MPTDKPLLPPLVPSLTSPLVAAGTLMSIYLLTRPYGDTDSDTSAQAAQSFADPRWVMSHVAGMLTLACIVWLPARLHRIHPTTLTRASRLLAALGLVLTLPYYGTEAFALHAIGSRAATEDMSLMSLIPGVRNQPVAMTMFTGGLLAFSTVGIIVAWAWQARAQSLAGWPLGILIAFFPAQFYLPPTGRMAFGVLFLLIACYWATRIAATQPRRRLGTLSNTTKPPSAQT